MAKKDEYPKKVDWSKYKFRCSSLGELMPGPRAKEGVLQKTQIGALTKIWMREVWGFEKQFTTKQMDKGNYSEQRGIDLVSKIVYGGFPHLKNEKRFSNDYVIGTPDLVTSGNRAKVHDIKCSYDLDTFMRAEATKANRLQVMAYQWILGIDKGEIDKCLLSAPDHMYEAEMFYLERRWQREDVDETSDRAQKEYYKLHLALNYDRIPYEKCLKRFEVNVTDDFIESVEKNVPIWREYLSKIEL